MENENISVTSFKTEFCDATAILPCEWRKKIFEVLGRGGLANLRPFLTLALEHDLHSKLESLTLVSLKHLK